MFVVTAAVKVTALLGWVSIFAVDFHAVEVRIATPLHNALLSALIVASVALVVRHKNRRDPDKRGGDGRTYSQGVVDGMKLATADPDTPAPRRGPGAKILYLRTGTNADPCTRRAPKPAGVRSSS